MTWRTFLVFATLAAVLLAATGAVVEALIAGRDAGRFPPPGRLVDVGGRKLHVLCAGAGSPTVVLEAGAGGWSLFWTRVQRDLSETTRVCAYDRAGYGWSDAATGRSPDALVADLAAVCDSLGERGPIVLAGHSMGGWLVRLYQARRPDRVAGLALIDSAHPRQWARLPPDIWRVTRKSARAMRWLGVLGRFGVMRLMLDRIASERLPADVIPAYRATAARPSAMIAMATDVAGSAALAAEVDRLGNLGALPLAVVTAGRSFDAFRDLAPDWPFDAANAAWMSLQDELAGLSTAATHYISPAATHRIYSDDPDLVVTALRDLVAAARRRSPQPAVHRRPMP